MGKNFRQSMAWLHTWCGLTVGWVLYFVFLTGTFGYIYPEIDRWMRPELPLHLAQQTPADALRLAESHLRTQAPDAQVWIIRLPGFRDSRDLSVTYRIPTSTNGTRARSRTEVFDPVTGRPSESAGRATSGGITLYQMHYSLHYLPTDVAIRIIGACAMFMLLAILTGVVTHKRIFADFFTFRPRKGQRSWLDAHNLLAVTTLPFLFMITWSGLLFYLFEYMPLPAVALHRTGESQSRFYSQAFGTERVDTTQLRSPAPLAPLVPSLVAAERHWGNGNVAMVYVYNPGHSTSSVRMLARPVLGIGRDVAELRFDGTTGRPLTQDVQRTAPGELNSIMLGLHEGRFAGPSLRFLYIASGLAGTSLIACGLLLWAKRRRQKLTADAETPRDLAVVETLNLGTILGLPIAIASYFWANRLIPVGMNERADWEINVLFIVWGLAFAYAIFRDRRKAWIEMCFIAAGAYGLLPLLNMFTTDRHLGITLPAGDWVLAGLDLSALGVGIALFTLARFLRR